MPSLSSENALVSLLNQCFITSKCHGSRRIRYRALSTAPRFRHPRRLSRVTDGDRRGVCSSVVEDGDQDGRRSGRVYMAGSKGGNDIGNGEKKPLRVAILGTGITGLAAAHWLTKSIPTAKITLFEKGDRVGGWVQSRFMSVGDKGGEVLFEMGPRTLRPGEEGRAVLKLVEDLGLQDQIITTDKNSDAARNRYIYYPDHLVRMPSPPSQNDFFPYFSILLDAIRLVREPITGGGDLSSEDFMRIIQENKMPPRSPELRDESVGSFLARRLGRAGQVISDNILSAILHGIYAGDVYQLSARSLFPYVWHQETFHGSLRTGVRKAMEGTRLARVRSNRITLSEDLEATLKDVSVYSFENGLGTLTTALENSLLANPNVTFKMKEKVTGIEYDEKNEEIMIKTARNLPEPKFTTAISTLPAQTLSSLLPVPIPELSSIHSVTAMVINLFYTNPSLLPVHGFGYLIPRSVPFDPSTAHVLGVVFDSDAIQGQDTIDGTKITVMLGGHWWNGWDSYPDEEEGERIALDVVKKHLGIDVKPDKIHVGLNRECIPQYTVGHDERIENAGEVLKDMFKGNLLVAGSSYWGVGLNDCVMGAMNVVNELVDRENGLGTGSVGLDGRRWVEVDGQGRILRDWSSRKGVGMVKY